MFLVSSVCWFLCPEALSFLSFSTLLCSQSSSLKNTLKSLKYVLRSHPGKTELLVCRADVCFALTSWILKAFCQDLLDKVVQTCLTSSRYWLHEYLSDCSVYNCCAVLHFHSMFRSEYKFRNMKDVSARGSENCHCSLHLSSQGT